MDRQFEVLSLSVELFNQIMRLVPYVLHLSTLLNLVHPSKLFQYFRTFTQIGEIQMNDNHKIKHFKSSLNPKNLPSALLGQSVDVSDTTCWVNPLRNYKNANYLWIISVGIQKKCKQSIKSDPPTLQVSTTSSLGTRVAAPGAVILDNGNNV